MKNGRPPPRREGDFILSISVPCAYLLGGGAGHDRGSAPLLVPGQADSSQRFFTNSQDVRDRHNQPQKSKRRRVGEHDEVPGSHSGASYAGPQAARIAFVLYWSKRLIGVPPSESGLDFFAGGPEYFKIIPLTWQDNEFIPVLMAKPAE